MEYINANKTYRMRIATITLFLLVFTGNLFSQALYYPERDEWLRKDPATAGFHAEKLKQALEYANSNEYTGDRDLRVAILNSFGYEPYMGIAGPTKKRGGPAGIILKDGYIVAEWGDIHRVDMTFSVTKSYLSAVTGLAWDDGLISSVDDPLYKYVWNGTFEGSHNMKITWEHLLNQSSDWSGQLFGMYDWADRPSRNQEFDDWRARELHEPGTFYKYNDVRVNLLAYSALEVLRQPLPMVLKERVMDPIGASTTWRWYGYENSWVVLDGLRMQSVSGGGHSGGGLFINTLDHARFGLLFARNGRWQDQQIISEQWIALSRQPSPANPAYGYLWWLNTENRILDIMPESVFYASGFGGNYIVIDQENDLVIVTRWLQPATLSDFLRLVYSSLE